MSKLEPEEKAAVAELHEEVSILASAHPTPVRVAALYMAWCDAVVLSRWPPVELDGYLETLRGRMADDIEGRRAVMMRSAS